MGMRVLAPTHKHELLRCDRGYIHPPAAAALHTNAFARSSEGPTSGACPTTRRPLPATLRIRVRVRAFEDTRNGRKQPSLTAIPTTATCNGTTVGCLVSRTPSGDALFGQGVGAVGTGGTPAIA